MLKRKIIVLSLVSLILISVGLSGVVGARGYNNERPAQKGQGLELALEQGLITETEYNELISNRKQRQKENRATNLRNDNRRLGQLQSRTRMFERRSYRGLMQPGECHRYNRRGSFRNRR